VEWEKPLRKDLSHQKLLDFARSLPAMDTNLLQFGEFSRASSLANVLARAVERYALARRFDEAIQRWHLGNDKSPEEIYYDRWGNSQEAKQAWQDFVFLWEDRERQEEIGYRMLELKRYANGAVGTNPSVSDARLEIAEISAEIRARNSKTKSERKAQRDLQFQSIDLDKLPAKQRAEARRNIAILRRRHAALANISLRSLKRRLKSPSLRRRARIDEHPPGFHVDLWDAWVRRQGKLRSGSGAERREWMRRQLVPNGPKKEPGIPNASVYFLFRDCESWLRTLDGQKYIADHPTKGLCDGASLRKRAAWLTSDLLSNNGNARLNSPSKIEKMISRFCSPKLFEPARVRKT
jgi:hypothetical protein